MSTANHTPGPWTAEATRAGKVFEVYFGDAEAGDAGCGWATLAGDNQAANARLVAAAPELLDALQRCLRYGGLYPDLAEEVRTLIAKATGEAA